MTARTLEHILKSLKRPNGGAEDGGIPTVIHAGRHRPAASDPQCWITEGQYAPNSR